MSAAVVMNKAWHFMSHEMLSIIFSENTKKNHELLSAAVVILSLTGGFKY